MKTLLLTALFTLISTEAFAVRLGCNFLNGSVHRANGDRVSRTFNPRVLRNARQVTLDIRDDEISLYSLMDMNLNRFGEKSCSDLEVREGFDCFRIFSAQAGEREFLVHVSQTLPRTATMIMGLGGVGGTFQNDQYRCR